MKVVRLSALRTGRLYSPGRIPGTHFWQRLSRTQGHNATGRIKSLKNSSDSIRNRTRDLPVCSTVPQPTAPPRTPSLLALWFKTARCQTHFVLLLCSGSFWTVTSTRATCKDRCATVAL
jgi:hypothetical protein